MHEVIALACIAIGLFCLFFAIRIQRADEKRANSPADSDLSDVERCWRCSAVAERNDGGYYWCADCYVAGRFTTPKLLDAKAGQTIMPPRKRRKVYEVQSMPWYQLDLGYNGYFQRKFDHE